MVHPRTDRPRQPTIPHGRFADQPIEAVPKHQPIEAVPKHQPIEAVPKHQLQWMQAMNVSVADKITALLERTDKLKRASDLGRPTTFDDAGERHAAAVAQRDQENN